MRYSCLASTPMPQPRWLVCNTSLRIKDECLIFTTAKICSNVNKLTRQKKRRNQNLPLTQTLKHRLSSTCHCEFFISVFSVSREGGWEFHPFLRAALGKICHVDLCAFFNLLWNHFHSWNPLSTSLCSFFPVLDILHFTGDGSGMSICKSFYWSLVGI